MNDTRYKRRIDDNLGVDHSSNDVDLGGGNNIAGGVSVKPSGQEQWNALS